MDRVSSSVTLHDEVPLKDNPTRSTPLQPPFSRFVLASSLRGEEKGEEKVRPIFRPVLERPLLCGTLSPSDSFRGVARTRPLLSTLKTLGDTGPPRISSRPFDSRPSVPPSVLGRGLEEGGGRKGGRAGSSAAAVPHCQVYGLVACFMSLVISS